MGTAYFPVGGMFDFREGKARTDPVARRLPSLTLSFVMIANTPATFRSSMLEQISQDYVRTARAKGCGSGRCFTPCFQECFTAGDHTVGMDVPALLSGTIVIESIFAWPGMDACSGMRPPSHGYPGADGLG